MIREISFFADALKPKNIFFLTFLFVLCRISIPFVARYIYYGNPFGLNWDGILYSVAETMVTMMISFMNYGFIMMAFIEMFRKYI